MLTAKEAPQVDAMIEAAMKASPTAAWAITHGMYAMGAPTPRAYLAAAQAYNLRDGYRLIRQTKPVAPVTKTRITPSHLLRVEVPLSSVGLKLYCEPAATV